MSSLREYTSFNQAKALHVFTDKIKIASEISPSRKGLNDQTEVTTETIYY